MAGHKRGRTCWRPTSRHRSCWCICGAGQADHILTVSQPRSSDRAIAPTRPCDICGRQRTSAMSSLGKGHCRTTFIWLCSASTCALVDVRAPWEGVATTTPFSAPGSFAAPCRNRRLPVRRGCIAASRAVPGGSLQNLAAQAPRGIRSHHQALRPRRHPLDGGTRGRTRGVGTGRYSQLFPGSREPLRQWNRREVDDQPARVLAVSCGQRPLPSRSRRCCSWLCPLAACRLAAISGRRSR